LNITRELIAGHDDLFSGFIKGIKDVEKFGLSAFFSSNELDVVDEQDVHAPKTVSKLVHSLVTDGVDEFIGEIFGREVTHRGGVGDDVVVEDVIADSVEKVSFAESDSAVNEEGIVILPREFGNGETSRIGELVAGADDEIIKGILRVEGRPECGRWNSDWGNGLNVMG